jgi:hypothetical protein
MKWVTRRRVRVNRTATTWLIRRFIDPAEITLTPESAGLRAISEGFPLVARDDHETVERAAFVYDALYASLKEREAEATT